MNAGPDAKNFATSQDVRWCPGCGDYAILKVMQRVLAEAGAKPENTVFVSGIGCASRFPYYIETYGFHTIHGRAPAIATGLKLANPKLDVWVVTGDGDGMSIGANHLLHALRRNVGLKILLFNNETYGLTKGQYSPTSRAGTRSPSSPAGSLDMPVVPGFFAIGAGARFIARAIDVDKDGLGLVLHAANQFEGASFVEIFQNCVVYNDGVFSNFTAREQAVDTQIHVKNGEPLLFGRHNEKGLRLNPETLSLEVIDATRSPDQIIVHVERNRALAQLLMEMQPPEFPMALGVIYRNPAPSFESLFYAAHPTQMRRTGRVRDALRQTNTWHVR